MTKERNVSTLNTWHASIGFSTRPMSEDALFEALDELASYGAALSVSSDYANMHATMTIQAASPLDAAKKAMNAIENVSVFRNVEIKDVRIVTPEKLDTENAEPIFPKVVGYAEIAKLAGVSRQRARQLSENSDFPLPVIETSQGPLFNQHAIERWTETRNTKPGRPAMATL